MTSIENFRNETKKTWNNPGVGGERLWMSTDTITAEDAELDKEWKSYFPSPEWYHRLRAVKLDIDPGNVFSSKMTIPLKEHEIAAHCSS
jgi:FAD/FMN-containing dehydrogenase